MKNNKSTIVTKLPPTDSPAESPLITSAREFENARSAFDRAAKAAAAAESRLNAARENYLAQHRTNLG